MRFMVLVIPEGYADAPAGTLPDESHVTKMMAFNEEMAEAGIMRDGNGLHPPAMGARLIFGDGGPQVLDGPFPEIKEVLGGYWIIEVASLEEAKNWFKRCPMLTGDILEIRQLQEAEEFSEDVQAGIERVGIMKE